MRTHYLSFLSFLISTSIFLYSNCREESETEILLQLKSQWGNPPALASWSSTSRTPFHVQTYHHCNWFGIVCTGGVVTEINLVDQHISQPIPDSICRLKNLSRLDLSHNDLHGTFPVFLYSCTSLRYLNISQNSFVGTLPSDIDRLPPSLTYLDLSGNNFSGDIPTSIGRLVGLKTLRLSGNLFSGTYPREIANLLNLERLSLAWNPFHKLAQIPHEFGKLTKLKHLWMTSTNTTGEIPDTWSNLTELEHLDLGWNKINGTFPSWIWSLEKLNILCLDSNELMGEISFTGHLIRCRGLIQLDLSRNKLTGSIPNDLDVFKNLSVLFLCYNSFSGEIPASIGSLRVLTNLNLSNNKLSGPIPEKFNNLKLNTLNLSANNLSGKIPSSLENKAYSRSFLSNPYLCSDSNSHSILNLPVCPHVPKTNPPVPDTTATSSSLNVWIERIAIYVIPGCGIVIAIVVWFLQTNVGIAVRIRILAAMGLGHPHGD